MVRFRKWLILTHRWLGIALSLLFVVWFVSGIAMMYARGMPRLTPEVRLERLAALDLARVRLSPSEAVERAELGERPERVSMLTVMDRPAYRFISRGTPVTVFADTGELLQDVGPAQAIMIAARFMNLPEGALHHAGVLTEADQWTIAQRRQMPLHKITVDDAARTELYIAEEVAEVAVQTTRGSRALAWVAAIPHWLYFAPLRLNDAVWRQVVLWTSGLGCVLALIGIAVGVLQFSPSRPFRLNRVLSYIPYTGWMRWHYITGVVFGVFSLTWVFSGLLSMEPWGWAAGGGLGGGIRQAFTGGPLDLSLFPSVDAATWDPVLPGRAIKEVEFLRIQGEPYYVVRAAEPQPLLMAANPLRVRREPFPIESLMSRVKKAIPDVPIVESQVLSEYDSYYYSRGEARPLPVLRLKFDDPEKTWIYIDPGMSQVVARVHRRGRLERWLYNGFHSLDFSFWYYNRPLWDISVIVLSIGGIVSSTIGLFIGIKRLQRNAKRTAKSWLNGMAGRESYRARSSSSD